MIVLDRVDFTEQGWRNLTKEILRDNEFNGSLTTEGEMIESVHLFGIREILINE